MPLHESQLTVPAGNALRNAAVTALRSGNSLVSVEHLLHALLSDQTGDAYVTLKRLGVDVDHLRLEVEQSSPAVQPDVFFVSQSEQKTTLGDDLNRTLESARDAAIAADSPQVDTHALLLGTLANARDDLLDLLTRSGISADEVRAQPVQVDETALFRPPPPDPARKRRRRSWRVFSISPIFIGLVAVMSASLYALWAVLLNQQFFLFLFIVSAWVVSLALHEFGHALLAYIGGDDSVVDQGYLTLNPLKYTHPLLSIVMPLAILLIGGIGLPGGAVYINRAAIRSRLMNVAVSAAGPIANLLFAVLLTIPFFVLKPEFALFDFAGGPFFWVALATQVLLQLSAIFINLLPIPGLDGYGILEPLLPDNIVMALWPIRRFGIMILIALFWYVEPFQEWFWTSIFDVLTFLGIDPGLAGAGLELLQFWKY